MKKTKSKDKKTKLTVVLCTCREDHILGDEFIVDNRKLWQLYPVDPGHCAISTAPVKLNIICGVAICRGETKAQILRETLSSYINGL